MSKTCTVGLESSRYYLKYRKKLYLTAEALPRCFPYQCHAKAILKCISAKFLEEGAPPPPAHTHTHTLPQHNTTVGYNKDDWGSVFKVSLLTRLLCPLGLPTKCNFDKCEMKLLCYIFGLKIYFGNTLPQ